MGRKRHREDEADASPGVHVGRKVHEYPDAELGHFHHRATYSMWSAVKYVFVLSLLLWWLPTVGQMIAEGLEKRQTFRRVLKQTVEKVMANRDVLGVRIGIAGRLGGAEMSRTEEIKRGRVPLQTLRADIDFAREQAYLPYGVIGVKVWIYRGDIFDKKEANK